MIDLFFWWLGCLISVFGGVGILAVVVWWSIDRIYTRFGDLKTFLTVYKKMLSERRPTRPAQ